MKNLYTTSWRYSPIVIVLLMLLIPISTIAQNLDREKARNASLTFEPIPNFNSNLFGVSQDGIFFSTTFSEEEGYSAGALGGQNNWVNLTPNSDWAASDYIAVTDEESSVGPWSVTLGNDPNIQSTVSKTTLSGVARSFDNSNGEKVTISMDVFISATQGADYILRLVDAAGGANAAFVRFDYANRTFIGSQGAWVNANISWPVNEWFTLTIKMGGDLSMVEYQIGEESISMLPLGATTNVDRIDLYHDNWHANEKAFFDNIKIQKTPPPLVEVASIAELLASIEGNEGAIFTLTNEVVVFLTQTTRNQKYIADATGTLLIDDADGIITTPLVIGDGITGLTGTVSFFQDSPQLVPSQDTGAPTSSNNFISARQIETLDELEASDRWDLVFIRRVSFQNTGNFANNANYTVEDSEGNSMVFRTNRTNQWDSGFASQPIPQGEVNIIAHVGAFSGNPQLYGYFYDMIYDANVIGEFELTGPANEASLVVEGLTTTEVDITWDAPEGVGEGISYTWLAKVQRTEFYVPFLAIPSNESGSSTTLTLNMGVLDAVLESAGLNVGEEVTLEWTVFAEGNGGGNFAKQTWEVTLERGVVEQPDFTISDFALISPENEFTLVLDQEPGTTVDITWEMATSEPATELLYTFHLDVVGGDFSKPIASIQANAGGTANELTLTYAAIDNLLADNGVDVGSSLTLDWIVTAEAGNVVKFANTAFEITFDRAGLSLPTISYANLQWPPTLDLVSGERGTVYAQVYAEGITEGSEASPRIQAWVGVSSENTNPADWPSSAWTAMEFNESKGNNDEYMGEIGPTTPGTYFYATRFQLDESEFVYGGFDGGFWDGVDNVSGEMTVSAIPISALIELRDAEPGLVYYLAEEVILYHQYDFRWQKYIIDETSGMLIDDSAGRYTVGEGDDQESAFEIGDGLTGITARLSLFNGLLQLVPVDSDVTVTSTDNFVLPAPATAADISLDNTSNVYLLEGVTFENIPASGVFGDNVNYTVNFDGTEFTFRTHRTQSYDSGFNGQPIPTEPVNMIAYVGAFNTPQITAIFYDEMAPADLISEFNLTAPANEAVLVLEGDENQQAVIEWSVANGAGIEYLWVATLPELEFFLPALMFESDADGLANRLTLPFSDLNDLLEMVGLDVGESLTLKWTVLALNDESAKYANQVWEVTLQRGVLTNAEVDPTLPTEVSLSQNYPNPFNPTTQINFALPGESMVTLTVYDILGRQVATLVNENMTAGHHSVNFDAGRLASGMYIYRLQAGSTTMTKKMMLVK